MVQPEKFVSKSKRIKRIAARTVASETPLSIFISTPEATVAAARVIDFEAAAFLVSRPSFVPTPVAARAAPESTELPLPLSTVTASITVATVAVSLRWSRTESATETRSLKT